MTIEYRDCRFCGQNAEVYRDGIYFLFKYSTRHYAHATCLAKARGGAEAARELIPEHERDQFDVAILDERGDTRKPYTDEDINHS